MGAVLGVFRSIALAIQNWAILISLTLMMMTQRVTYQCAWGHSKGVLYVYWNLKFQSWLRLYSCQSIFILTVYNRVEIIYFPFWPKCFQTTCIAGGQTQTDWWGCCTWPDLLLWCSWSIFLRLWRLVDVANFMFHCMISISCSQVYHLKGVCHYFGA